MAVVLVKNALFALLIFGLLIFAGCASQEKTGAGQEASQGQEGPQGNAQGQDAGGIQQPAALEQPQPAYPSSPKISECENGGNPDTCYYLKAAESKNPPICTNINYGPQKAQCLFDSITSPQDCEIYKKLLGEYEELCPKMPGEE